MRDVRPDNVCSGSKAVLVSRRLQCPVCPRADIEDCPKGAVPVIAAICGTGGYGISAKGLDYSGLMLAARITLAHFSV
jgi:hypothetical protein